MPIGQVWQVEILRGDQDIVPSEATKFGIPTLTLGDGAAKVPLLYGPVLVRSIDRSLVIETVHQITQEEMDAEKAEQGHTFWNRQEGAIYFRNLPHREMRFVQHIEFDDWGHVRVEGMEERKDGSLVAAVWEIGPYVHEEPEEAGDDDA